MNCGPKFLFRMKHLSREAQRTEVFGSVGAKLTVVGEHKGHEKVSF